MSDNNLTENEYSFARHIESNQISAKDPYHWLELAVEDFKRAPLISLFYGALFSLIPALILLYTVSMGTHVAIFPAVVAFALIGPIFAVAMYDVAWELEKGHKPTLRHSIKSFFRNPVGEWGFALVLLVLMILWMRVAHLLQALYPTVGQPSLSEMAVFLTIGSLSGALLLGLVFMVSAFTPQICLERKVDPMTAIATSFHAVKQNKLPMLVWASIIGVLVTLGFATSAIGFIVIMPLLSFASWHAYIAVIKTKRVRNYE